MPTPQDQIIAHRLRLNRLRSANEVIYPWLHYIFEQGRISAHLAITEMDITSQFTDPEDRIIALFASLAAPPDREDFASCDIFQHVSPRDMVYKRLFTEVNGKQPFSVTRFKRLMDILWQWQQDYYSVYDAFTTLVHDPDPLSTLIWMFSDSKIPIQNPDYRLPRFLMALMLDDQGIGQAILPYKIPENLTCPPCPQVIKLHRIFCPIKESNLGELASILGLQYETDLYYLAIGWQQLTTQHPNEVASIIYHIAQNNKQGGQDCNQRDPLKKYFRLILPDVFPAPIFSGRPHRASAP